ncbi:hypothetical protein ACXKGW_29735, partial [Klebsiella pneumoniae subsp. pneumoniae]
VINRVFPRSGYFGTWRQGFDPSGRMPQTSAMLNVIDPRADSTLEDLGHPRSEFELEPGSRGG